MKIIKAMDATNIPMIYTKFTNGINTIIKLSIAAMLNIRY
jgi:hypothetical protein